ncbi:MAG TPA: DUF4350 domain-containing protein [Rubricoccaceae bacterium]|jgi:hypothetical protein
MKRALPVLIIGGVALLLVGIELSRPRPYDPRLRVERDGTEPFDAEVLYRLLPGWLGAPVEAVDVTPFERLADTTLTQTVYVFATDTFMPDAAEADRLLAFVARGNTVVAAADVVGGAFFEALGEPPPPSGLPGDDVPISQIRKNSSFREPDGVTTTPRPLAIGLPDFESGFPGFDGGVLGADTLRLGSRTVTFPVALNGATFEGIDRTRTAVLATDPTTGDPTAIAVAVGRGRVVLLATPLVLTNAALAGEGDAAAYVAGALAYVPPVRRVLWDDTYKPLRTGDESRLRYAARTPALRWAIAMIALGAVLAVGVWGRRRQRPIPVVAPPPNAQREFARTVGRLFFVRGDRAWLARRKARLFEDALRTRLGLADADLTDATARRAAARAGVPEADALALFARVRDLATDPVPDASALLRADRDTDAFFATRNAPARPDPA